MAAEAQQGVNVFCSYSHDDEKLRNRLKAHLAGLENRKLIGFWTDREISPGGNWASQIDQQLERAELILLLISASFIHSRYCMEIEGKRAYERAQREEATVIPIILKPVHWKGESFSDLQALPRDAKPVTLWRPMDAAFAHIAEQIETEARRIQGRRAAPAAPRAWNVPLGNRDFVGREGMLASLAQRLGFPGGHVQALVGPPGLGKSEAAVQFAWRHRQDYDVVWRIRAEEPATLASDYAGLSAELGLTAADQAESIRAAREWLASHSRWLVILDNAAGPDAVRDYIPRHPPGHVVITSRHAEWGDLAEVIPVATLTASEGSRFLQRMTGDPDESAARELATVLQGVPLALEQAAATVVATGGTLQEYLRLHARQVAGKPES